MDTRKIDTSSANDAQILHLLVSDDTRHAVLLCGGKAQIAYALLCQLIADEDPAHMASMQAASDGAREVSEEDKSAYAEIAKQAATTAKKALGK